MANKSLVREYGGCVRDPHTTDNVQERMYHDALKRTDEMTKKRDKL